VSWLQDIANTDGVSLGEAASYVVALGVHLDVTAYLDAGRDGRAALLAAQHAAHVARLQAEGRDLDAARAFAPVDGGRTASRLMCEAATHGVARALRSTREGAAGG
jgi:hypothetical protein